MKKTLLLAVLFAGCAPSNYYYNFDLTDPGANNLSKPGQMDTLEDNDIKAEMYVDPTTFQGVALYLTNKTDRTVEVQWNQVIMVGPDLSRLPVQPDQQLGWIEPGLRVFARLVPFALPPAGDAAKAFDNTKFEFDVPMVVRGVPKTYAFHLIVHMQKL